MGCKDGYAASQTIKSYTSCTDGIYSSVLDIQCEPVCEDPPSYTDKGIQVNRTYGEVRIAYLCLSDNIDQHQSIVSRVYVCY